MLKQEMMIFVSENLKQDNKLIDLVVYLPWNYHLSEEVTIILCML